MSNKGKGLLLPSKNLNHLPPKRPTTATNSAHADSLRFHNGLSRTSNQFAGYQNYDNDSDIIPPTEPSWLNELLDSPKVSGRKFSHRRSASDTNAFFEFPSNLTKAGSVAGEDEPSFFCKSHSRLRGSLDFDRLEEEQFLQRFSHLQLWENSPGSIGESFSQAHNEAASVVGRSSVESWTPFSHLNNTALARDLLLCHGDKKVVQSSYLKGGLEVEGVRVGVNCNENVKHHDYSSMLENEAVWEVEQAKGPSNRQSAQRSRVRKLQYIAELERRVNVLETELATLSPQVVLLDRQRSLLTADNKVLKKRIAVALNEKQLKDSHFEVLKKERQRLKVLFLQQNNQLASHVEVSTPQVYYGKLQDKKAAPAVTDTFVRLVRASSMPPPTQEVGMTTGWGGGEHFAVKY